MNWSDRTIVVTGASSGIGLRVAELLVEGGARVIALDRNPPPLAVAAHVTVDLGDPDSIDAAVAAIEGPLHGLCNIAGVPQMAGDRAVCRVNYLGLRHLTLGLLPRLARGAGIVNLSSTAGYGWRDRAGLLWDLAQIEGWGEAEAWIAAHPVMFEDAYDRFKEALVVWTQAVASDWFLRHGVRMNCVSPGPVQTPIFETFTRVFGTGNVEDILARTGRVPTPDDIAPPVLFLLDYAARWIVGVDLPVEGGLSASRFASGMREGRA